VTSNPFAIVGGGWRAEFFLRVAAALASTFGVTTPATLDDLSARRVPALSETPPAPDVVDFLAPLDRWAFARHAG